MGSACAFCIYIRYLGLALVRCSISNWYTKQNRYCLTPGNQGNNNPCANTSTLALRLAQVISCLRAQSFPEVAANGNHAYQNLPPCSLMACSLAFSNTSAQGRDEGQRDSQHVNKFQAGAVRCKSSCARRQSHAACWSRGSPSVSFAGLLAEAPNSPQKDRLPYSVLVYEASVARQLRWRARAQ